MLSLVLSSGVRKKHFPFLWSSAEKHLCRFRSWLPFPSPQVRSKLTRICCYIGWPFHVFQCIHLGNFFCYDAPTSPHILLLGLLGSPQQRGMCPHPNPNSLTDLPQCRKLIKYLDIAAAWDSRCLHLTGIKLHLSGARKHSTLSLLRRMLMETVQPRHPLYGCFFFCCIESLSYRVKGGLRLMWWSGSSSSTVRTFDRACVCPSCPS